MKIDECFANRTDTRGGGRAIAFFFLLQRNIENSMCVAVLERRHGGKRKNDCFRFLWM